MNKRNFLKGAALAVAGFFGWKVVKAETPKRLKLIDNPCAMQPGIPEYVPVTIDGHGWMGSGGQMAIARLYGNKYEIITRWLDDHRVVLRMTKELNDRPGEWNSELTGDIHWTYYPPYPYIVREEYDIIGYENLDSYHAQTWKSLYSKS